MISAANQPALEKTSGSPPLKKSRIGFLGTGWIGRNRLEAVARSGLAETVVIGEPNRAMAESAQQLASDAAIVQSLDQLLEFDLDGLVIATPSAMHSEQATAALKSGSAVFCQKPLGRTAAETAAVVAAARSADRLLGVDLSYQYLTEVQKVRELVQSGELGHIYALDLVFHNAYGPDKDWFYDRNLSGGGCVIDLGIHLVHLALWLLDFPDVTNLTSSLFYNGNRVPTHESQVEDFASGQFDLANGATCRFACSWRLHAGADALIEASLFGTRGGACVSNMDGSFYRFRAERFNGTARQLLSEDPDPWGGRAILHWIHKLNSGERFDPEIEHLTLVSTTLDRIYQQGAGHAHS